jgi:hypothetical protein
VSTYPPHGPISVVGTEVIRERGSTFNLKRNLEARVGKLEAKALRMAKMISSASSVSQTMPHVRNVRCNCE